MDKKEFTAALLDPEYEIYIIHIGSLSSVALPSSSLLKKFAAAVLDPEYQIYIVHVGSVSSIASPSFSSLQKFVAAALDLEHETYIVYIGSISSVALPNSFPLNVHLIRRPQIAGLVAKKTPTKVSVEYVDFTNVFSPDLTSKLSKHTRINNQAIELVDGQQLLYKPIYNIKAGKTIQVTRRCSHFF